jgi:hypothetical protein
VQGKNYNLKVSAFNIYGDGPLSDPFMITPAAEPNAPTSLVLVSQNTLQITFSWTMPYDGGKAITDFKVYYDNARGDRVFDFLANVGSATNSYTHATNLQPGAFYEFKVAAVNAIGTSLLSAYNTPKFIAAMVPGGPLLLRTVSADKNHISIAWSAPTVNNGSTVITYKVYMDGVEVSPAGIGTNGLLTWT